MVNLVSKTVETPSGKDVNYENFPVGSFLLPAHLRPHIACYYRFARAIDDIADNPQTSADEKISRLEGFAKSIRGDDVSSPAYAKGHQMRKSLNETNVSEKHCLDLITAFKQDAVKNRYQNWEELVDYCLLSAAPVGRYLIDLHGGTEDGYGPSDALCIILQVINHLQDCKEDFLEMDRVYIPADWMITYGVTVESLNQPNLSDSLCQVLDKMIFSVAELMPEAYKLPYGLYNRRLAMESQVIINVADSLIEQLIAKDPLAERVKLSKPAYVWCVARGLVGYFAPRNPN
jgi:squalene synthase HpnC